MSSGQEQQEQRQTLQKRVALKEDGYYANCAMVEMYDRQVYLSHLQARALYEALGRSLGSLGRRGQQDQGQESKAGRAVHEGIENS